MISIVRRKSLRQKAHRKDRARLSNNCQLEEVIIVIKLEAIKTIGKKILPSMRGGSVSIVIKYMLETVD